MRWTQATVYQNSLIRAYVDGHEAPYISEGTVKKITITFENLQRRQQWLTLTLHTPEGWEAQLVTGFAIGETDAVYARSGENAMLCARDGETVYMIIAQADEQTLYALGVDAETK